MHLLSVIICKELVNTLKMGNNHTVFKIIVENVRYARGSQCVTSTGYASSPPSWTSAPGAVEVSDLSNAWRPSTSPTILRIVLPNGSGETGSMHALYRGCPHGEGIVEFHRGQEELHRICVPVGV
jgi:hypothetical protein